MSRSLRKQLLEKVKCHIGAQWLLLSKNAKHLFLAYGSITIKITHFSKSGKWHETIFKEFNHKLGERTCSFPNFEAFQ